MLTADTNVWARALLNDHKAQTKTARSALAHARSSDGVFVPLIVLAELSWVLRARWERERILNALDGMLRARGVSVESPVLARKALEAARSGPVGFADHLIAEIAFDVGAREILTFDRAFARRPRVRRLG
ncbi:MAG TPA: type II toxin-antitoxin system VapC family toxin [Acidobacteriaceae bacterium]|nr:type II toxin-antitoxin system VapC family toxin [Acidobacteriaceae bacterium]